MRLNFNNIGRGLEAIADAKRAQDLAQTSAKYDVTEGAYGEGLGQNLQQVIGARDQALQGLGEQATPEQRQQVLDQYTPAMSELSRRVGLQGPDYSIASGGQNFDTRQDARMAAAPLRAEALAGVYRRYGDVERADALEARALEQQRGLSAEQRASAEEIRRQQQFITGQQESGLRINTLAREAEQVKKLDDVDKQAGEFLTTRLTDADGNTRAATTDDMLAQLQHRTMLLQKNGLGKQATEALRDYQGIAVNAIQLQTAERGVELGRVAAAIGQGDLNPARAFYDKFVHDGAKTTSIKENKDGSITVSRVRDDGTPLPDTKVASKDALLATLNSFKDPMSLYNYSKDQFERNIKTEQLGLQKRQTAATEANVRVSQETLQLNKDKEDRLAKPIQTMIEDLKGAGIETTPADVRTLAKLDKGESALVKAQIDAILKSIDPLQPKSLETAQAKITDVYKGVALQDRNKQIVIGLTRAKKDGNEESAIATLRQNGIGEDTIAGLAKQAGVTYTPPASAPPAETSPAAAPTSGVNTSRTGTGEVNPYVTTSGRPTGLTSGAPSVASQVLPQIAQSVENAVGTTAAATRYLQGKISRNEPLSPADTARARQLGLIK